MKKVILNILLFSIITYISFIVFDEIVYFNDFKSFKNLKLQKIESYFTYFSCVEGEKYENKPIMLFGCSFANGPRLKKEQKLAYKLAILTKRPIYNYSLPGYGVQPMLYFFSHDMNPDVKPEYIIYTFIDDHIRRLYNGYEHTTPHCYFIPIKYFEIGGKFYEYYVPCPRIIGSYWLAKLKDKIYYDYYYSQDVDKNFDLLKAYFLQSRKLAIKKFPNAKFVIFIYDYFPDRKKYAQSKRWSELEKEGFIIINSADFKNGQLLETREFSLPNDNHPNAKAWDLIVPQLVAKLNL